MPRQKKKPERWLIKSQEKFRISPETRNGIWVIVSFSLAILTVLSFAGKGGKVGNFLTGLSETLFGWGFFIIPFAFIILGVSFLKYYHRRANFGSILGVLIFVLAILGVFFILGNDKGLNDRILQGGYLGVIFGYPLLNMFGFISSIVILFAAVFISFLVALDIPLHKLLMREKKEEDYSDDQEDFQEDKLVIRQGEKPLKPFFRAKTISSEERVRKEEGPAEFGEPEFSVKVGSRKWKLPPLDLLRADSDIPKAGDIAANAAVIRRTLSNFGLDVEMGEVNVGPTVTQFTLRPAVGVKLSKITSLQNDLALSLASHPIRIEAPIPGKSLVGIEVPNRKSALVGLKNLLELEDYQKSPNFFPLVLGRDVAGYPYLVGLEKMPHLLIAGATGSGKSVCINSIILSLLYKHSPDILKFIMIDPKRVELSLYNGIPHLVTPVIVENKKAINSLRWLVKEMERRYEVISATGSRDIFSFNTRQASKKEPLMPLIILVIDELADLMAAFGREIEGSIVRLAQMSRAVGIHLIVSTQRPSVEVITGLIKANITTRLAFQVASQVDSRTILDVSGSEKLLGNGDMLFLASNTSKPRRLQGAFVSEKEVKAVVKFLKDQEYETEEEEIVSEAEKLEESLAQGLEGAAGLELERGEAVSDFNDPLLASAKEVVVQAKKASASLLQRRLRVGYARAARLLDILEEQGVVGPADGAKPREVLVKSETNELSQNDNTVDEKQENNLI